MQGIVILIIVSVVLLIIIMVVTFVYLPIGASAPLAFAEFTVVAAATTYIWIRFGDRQRRSCEQRGGTFHSWQPETSPWRCTDENFEPV